MYKNSEILSAVLNKWAQPLVGTFINEHLQSMPFIQGIQNKIRSIGWVSPNWTLMGELSPIMEAISGNIVAPMITKYIAQIDDASIPKIAHAIVDNALKNKELVLFEGTVVFEEGDLKKLKRLLDLNLPYHPEKDVIVITD